MIKIKVCYENDKIKNFKVSGHANYDTYGKDIVCASVSSIVITSCNMALTLDDKSISYVEKEGLKDDDIINKVFVNMINMLKELENDYKTNIKFV